MPCRASSGAHEWINEIPTVPASGPMNAQSRFTVLQPPTPREDPVEFHCSLALSSRTFPRSVGRSVEATLSGVVEPKVKHYPRTFGGLTFPQGREQCQVDSSAGAALPRKDNTGAQRSAQVVQNATVECKGKSWPDEILQRTGSRRESAA